MNKRTGGLIAAAVVGMCSLAFGAGKPAAAFEIASLEQLANEMATLKVLPKSTARMTLTTGFGAMLGNPALAGVDVAKPIDIYIFLPKAESIRSNTAAGPVEGPGVAFVFSASSNKMDCIAAMAQTFPFTNKVGSIYEFSSAQGAPRRHDRKMFVGFVADRMVAGSQLAGVQDTVALVERQKGESALFMKLPGTLRGGVDIQVMVPYLQSMSELASARMGSCGKANPGQPDPGKLLKAEMELLLKLIGDIQGFSFSLSVTPESVNIRSRVDPKDGTAISRLVSGDVPPSARYMALPPPDALFFWVGSGMDKWMDVFGEPYMAMLDKMGAAMGPQGADMGSVFRQMMKEMKGLYASDIAMAVVAGPDGKPGFMEFFAVTDAVKAKQAMDKMISTYNSNPSAMTQGIAIQVGAERSYKDVRIQSYSYAVTAVSNMPLQAVSNLMSKMSWESAFKGNHMIYVMGSSNLMNAAIDRLSVSDVVPVTSGPLFTSVFPQIKGTPACVYSASLVKLAKKGMALVPGVDPARLAAVPDKTGGMAGYVTISGDNLISTDRIMLDEIEGLKLVLPMLGNVLPGLLMPQGASSSRRPHAGAHQGNMPTGDSEEEAE